MGHETAKVSANNAVPGDTLALIELCNHQYLYLDSAVSCWRTVFLMWCAISYIESLATVGDLDVVQARLTFSMLNFSIASCAITKCRLASALQIIILILGKRDFSQISQLTNFNGLLLHVFGLKTNMSHRCTTHDIHEIHTMSADLT